MAAPPWTGPGSPQAPKKTPDSQANGQATQTADRAETTPQQKIEADAEQRAIARDAASVRRVTANSPYGEFNPPPHKLTRSIAIPAQRSIEQDPLYYFGKDNNPINTDETFSNLYNTKGSAFQNLGYIYQDPSIDGSSILNNNAIGTGNIAGRKYRQVWGFRFLYNPASIVHDFSANAAIDWTLMSQAVPLSGTGTISFELLLNRVVDVNVLPSTPREALKTSYGIELLPEHVEGLKNRGTSYDLDYLFRTTNGDPAATSPQLEPGQATADYGFLLAAPVWIVFGQNQRFKGFISAATVSHGMFNTLMVPTLTTVRITFVRIPVMSYNAQDDMATIERYKPYAASTSSADSDPSGSAPTP